MTNVYASSSSGYTVTLADGSASGTGFTNDCSVATNGPTLTANLCVSRVYTLTVVATNLQHMDLDFAVIPPMQFLANTGPQASPKNYTVLVNGQAGSSLGENTASADGSCDYVSNSWTVELRANNTGRWELDDGCDDPTPAPGDGTFPQIGPGNSVDPSRIAISWYVALGRLYDGLAAGRLCIKEPGLSTNIYTPSVLFYAASSTNVRSQVQLVTGSDGVTLRQVQACQTFVDIVSPDTNSTTMNFYLPIQVATNTDGMGVFTSISGSPFVSWTLQNPNPGTSNNLLIVESRNGLNRTNSLVYNPASTAATWTLTYGTGNEQRIETRGVSITTNTLTNRVETDTIQAAGASSPAYMCIETYQLYPWGFALAQTQTDPAGSNLVTTFTYYTDTNSWWSYGQIATIVYPDRYWESRAYYDINAYFGDDTPFGYGQPPGGLWYVLHPAGDSPADPAGANPASCEAIQHYYLGWDSPHPAGFESAEIHSWMLSLGTLTMDRPAPANFISLEGDGTYGQDSDGTGGEFIRSYMTPIINEGIGCGFCAFPRDVSMWPDSAGAGFAGHIYVQSVLQPNGFSLPPYCQQMYFDGGTYDTNGDSFTPGANNDPYISLGPDWRQRTYYHDDDVFFFNGGFHAGQETQIFHNGSLAQRELAVVTNVDCSESEDSDSNQNQWWPNVGCDAPYQVLVYQNDFLGHATNISVLDTNTGLSRTVYEADYKGSNSAPGDLLFSETDESGIVTNYQYDSLKRIISKTKGGVSGSPYQPTIVTTLAYDACNQVLQQATAGGGLVLTQTWSYDLSGRLISNVDTTGLATGITYQSGGKVIVTNLPSGALVVRTNYLDRRLHSITGDGVVAEYHSFDVEPLPNGCLLEFLDTMAPFVETVTSGDPNSLRWKKTGSGSTGITEMSEVPDVGGINVLDTFYPVSLHLQPLGVQKPGVDLQWLYKFFDGIPEDQRVDNNGPYCVDQPQDNWAEYTGYYIPPPSIDHGRIRQTIRQFVQQSNVWFQVESNLTYLADNDSTPTVVSVKQVQLGGFAANVISQITTWDADTNATVVTTYVNRAAKTVTVVTNASNSTLAATNIVVNGLLQSASTLTVAQPTLHYYDALGRETSVVSPLGFTMSRTYNSAGQVASQTDFAGNTTSYSYYGNGNYGAGQVSCQTDPNGKNTYYSYTAVGKPYRIWGDVPYPQEMVYSEYGELVELHTFRGGSGWNGANWPGSPGSYDKTTWTYDGPSGVLLSKTDAASNTVSYTYTNGMLWTRTWARGVTLTNIYDEYGEVQEMDYSDGTPSVLIRFCPRWQGIEGSLGNGWL